MIGAPVSSLSTVQVVGEVFTFTQPARSLPLKSSATTGAVDADAASPPASEWHEASGSMAAPMSATETTPRIGRRVGRKVMRAH
jgi:hypothetical protein